MDRWGRALGDCLLYGVPYGYRAPPTGCIEFLAWRVTESSWSFAAVARLG